VGGEGREEFMKKLTVDVWNRYTGNLWRSDAGISSKTKYNESDAASEVSWVIVFLTRKKDPLNEKS
jgi:hypothetical protein